MKFCILVGHTELKPGARFERDSFTEYIYNNILAREISFILGSRNCEGFIVNKDNILHNQLIEIVDYQKPKAIIELHCDAYNKNVRGSSALFTENNKFSKNLSKCIQKEIVEVFNRKGKYNRGIKLLLHKNDKNIIDGKPKPKTDMGYHNLINFKSPACIIEPFFIDNDKDLILGLSKISVLASAITEGLLNFSRS